jgi:hypothetical protein
MSREPLPDLVPTIVRAVKAGAVQRGTIRAFLLVEGHAVAESTLSGILRMACAQGVLSRTGEKRGTRYRVAKWRTRTARPARLAELEPVELIDDAATTTPALPDFEDL